MRKKLFFSAIMLMNLHVCAEDIFIKSKKKESCAKLKEQLATSFEDLIQLSTTSIRNLSNVIDEIALGVKQLVGQQQGVLSTSDRKVLESYQQRADELKVILEGMIKNCNLDVSI